VKAAAEKALLPAWRDTGNKVDPECSNIWNATVGKAQNIQIK